MAQVSVQRVSAQWGASRLPTRRAVQHRARVAAPTRCEFDVDNASILVAGKTRGGAGRVKEERVKEEAALSRAAIPAMQGTGWVVRRNAVLARRATHPRRPLPPPPPLARPAGGGGCALQITKRLKDAGSWVWQLQRTDVRRCVQAYSAGGLLVGRAAVQARWRRRAVVPPRALTSRAAAQEGD